MTLDEVKNKYKEPWRFHHTLSHVNYIIENMVQWCNENDFINNNITDIINYAAIFHDAVYNPKAINNEAQSSALWLQYAKEHKINSDITDIVNRIILSTKHPEYANDILEIAFNRFDWLNMGYTYNLTDDYKKMLAEYELNVSKEYVFVPNEIYKRERKNFINRAVKKSLITNEVKNYLFTLIS